MLLVSVNIQSNNDEVSIMTLHFVYTISSRRTGTVVLTFKH